MSLGRTTAQVTFAAMGFDLADMATDGLPPFDLAQVLVGHTAAHIISAIPLKPSARIVGVDPAFAPPFAKGLARIGLEEVEHRIFAFRREFGASEPTLGELSTTVGHVFATKNAHAKHLSWSQFRFELRMKITARRFGPVVNIMLLHLVRHQDFMRSAGSSATGLAGLHDKNFGEGR